jgi:hypothetical protein
MSFVPASTKDASLWLQSYLRDLRSLGEVDGLNSGIYSLLTGAFVGAGLAYIFAPAQVRALSGTAFFQCKPVYPTMCPLLSLMT